MRRVMVAVVGPDEDAGDVILRSLREFPAAKVVLLTERGFLPRCSRIKEQLRGLGVESEHMLVGSVRNLEELFAAIKAVKEREDSVIINVDADYMSSCLALSSAFVNGVQAIGLMGDAMIAYPIMKFSYYSALSEKKLKVLRQIFNKGPYDSLESLGKAVGMNLPLIAYHIGGAPGKPGLVELGLVETAKKGRRLKVELTKLGELLVKGAVEVPDSKRKA